MPGIVEQIDSLAALHEPVRRALYAYVAGRDGPASRDAAARAVGISRALAAFHLDKLVAAGLLDASYRRPTGKKGPGAGRPAKLYRRAARQLDVTVPARRYELAGRLLVRTLARHAPPATKSALRREARRLGREIGREQRERSKSGRVEGLLRECGYEPARSADGVVRMKNCPFHALQQDQRELTCGMNLALIRGMLDGLDARGVTATPESRPGFCCVALRTGRAT